jgi:hypothetical protein
MEKNPLVILLLKIVQKSTQAVSSLLLARVLNEEV